MSEDRIIRLEEEVSHLRQINDELSGELAAQWKSIAKLEKVITLLESRINGLEDQSEAPAANTKPPHW